MEMGAAFDLDAVGNAIAEAAADPARWDSAMDVAAKATGSFGAMLFDMKSHLPGIPRSRAMGPSIEAYVGDGWIDRDDRYDLGPLMVRRGVVSDLDALTPEEIARRPYYQEFLAPHGLRWFAGVKAAAGDDLWCLSIQRSIQQGPFSPSEIQLLADFSKQLGSAVAFARMLSFARAEGAMGAFTASGTPAVMLDRNAAVILVNEPAERLFGRDLRVTGRHLACADRNATDTLRRALHGLLRNPNPPAMSSPIPLPRLQGRPLLAYPLRLPGITSNAFASCQVVVVFIDPDIYPQPPDVALRTCFGLTPAEARLARRVSSGEELKTAADHLGISYETARNQLKVTFAKTDTHRQAELVALLARMASTALR
ncbi:MAG: helix-turn-helix transcriptional regulator [Mesorhizobium sp.]|uniref:helix-turn-helix transcriptional regulator n=2 Tax=unclassified Mesorhizobium TaxID=325217 RepID=UPI000FD25D81|nr:helix-turn-helix transcriptional regulator [Mesorhizobium sp. M5C.F.Ca.IN.020.32.2.1]RWG38777.1 MAG: helix-turn-helix transcriptional regulator [Mesorhizobium sp.]RUV30211.1 helix-turn-helix transcriptional regulator [Mesorhizobium sp. M5C.F.Ca.IN.020.32.2.1]RWH36654.1 MAG: helix-turn-helix transcriptional regulator [Mesorhizobium sp.]RWH49244.1 MAG: helix-turn-helix transcriptional regulator [Mesorhizobium sp.]RWI62614.1 MAG: helix-turn-helix transcriptional regulator [Mesorhizobium sp.]